MEDTRAQGLAGGRIEYIDFAKGYAIFTVVVYHVLQRAGLPPLGQQAIIFGGTGVHLFFLLSGFGLAFGKTLAAAAFYRRRLTKVWLPYVLALTLSLLTALAWNLFPDRWAAWLAGVLLYQMFFERFMDSFGGHFWFISAIMQFYLVYPALIWLRRRMPSAAGFSAICLGISVAWWRMVYVLDKADWRTWNSFFLQFLWEFGLGMVLGEMVVRRRRGASGHPSETGASGRSRAAAGRKPECWSACGNLSGMALVAGFGDRYNLFRPDGPVDRPFRRGRKNF